MTTTGPQSAGTFANNSGVGSVAWTLGSPNSVSPGTGNQSYYLWATGFDFSAIDDTDVIDAIRVRVNRNASVTNRINDNSARLIVSGAAGGTEKAAAGNWSTSATNVDYGDLTSDKHGYTGLTGADVKSSFGFAFSINGNAAAVGYVNSVEITIVHSPGAAGVEVTVTQAVIELAEQAVSIELGDPPAVEIAVSQATIELAGQAVSIELGTPPGVTVAVTQAAIELAGQAVSIDLGTPPGVTVAVTQATIELAEQAVSIELGDPPAGIEITVNQAVIELAPSIGITIQAPGAARLIGVPTPLPISVSSLDYVDHTARTISHSIVASSSPLATSSLLKSNDSGYLRLVRLGLGMDPSHPLDVAGNIRLSGDLLHSGDLDIEASGGDLNFVNTDIQAHNWTSGTTGWGIQHDGDADFRNITADTLTVEAFIADVNLALAGSQIITKSLAILAQAFTVPSTTGFLYVYDLPGFPNTAVFENGDIVRLRYVEAGAGLVVGDAWGTVASYADQADGSQRWTFTRTSGTVGQVVSEGMGVLDYGASGDGYVHTTTLDPAGSPYTEIGTWATDPSSGANHTIHVRLGNLDGIAGVGTEYGLWAGQSGEAFLLLSDTNFEAHGLALSLYDDDGEAIRLDPAGPYLAIGYPLPSGMSSGGAGLWVGLDGSDYMLRLGEAAGVGLRWNGSDLSLRNAADAAVITLDAAGNSYFAGPMTLGASGGIYQGTGTFGSPTTGLKIWRDGSIGRIGGYNSGTLQWYANTDGKLYAGGGSAILDADGIKITPGASSTYASQSALNFNNGATNVGHMRMYRQAGTSKTLAIEATAISGEETHITISARNTIGNPYASATLRGGAVSLTLQSGTAITSKGMLSNRLDVQTGGILSAPTSGEADAASGLTSGDVGYFGNLISYKNSTNYDVYAMRYLTTALASTSWDGDSKTSGNNGTIDLSAVFGVPAGVKAVLVRLAAQSASTNITVNLGPSSTNFNALVARTQVANIYSENMGVVPCNASGDFYVTISGTVNVFIEIWGYAL